MTVHDLIFGTLLWTEVGAAEQGVARFEKFCFCLLAISSVLFACA